MTFFGPRQPIGSVKQPIWQLSFCGEQSYVLCADGCSVRWGQGKLCPWSHIDWFFRALGSFIGGNFFLVPPGNATSAEQPQQS